MSERLRLLVEFYWNSSDLAERQGCYEYLWQVFYKCDGRSILYRKEDLGEVLRESFVLDISARYRMLHHGADSLLNSAEKAGAGMVVEQTGVNNEFGELNDEVRVWRDEWKERYGSD